VLPAAPLAACMAALRGAGVLAAHVEAAEAAEGLAEATLPKRKLESSAADKKRGAKPALAAPSTGHPQERLLDFVSVYSALVRPEEEFGALVAIFARGLDAECEARGSQAGGRRRRRRLEAAAGGGGRPGRASGGMKTAVPISDSAERGATDAAYTRNLLQQLLGGRVTAEVPLDRPLTVASLRVLIALLSLPAAEAARRRRRQCLLADEGACSVCLMMGASEDAQLYGMGMELAIALLAGGNARVQAAMHARLASGAQAFDGTNGAWMMSVKLRLRRGVKEISERKLFIAQQAERREFFSDEVAGLSAAAVAAVRADLERDFESEAFVLQTVEALRLLCEGHFGPLQVRGGKEIFHLHLCLLSVSCQNRLTDSPFSVSLLVFIFSQYGRY